MQQHNIYFNNEDNTVQCNLQYTQYNLQVNNMHNKHKEDNINNDYNVQMDYNDNIVTTI